MSIRIPRKAKKWFIRQLCGDIESGIPRKPRINMPTIRSFRIDHRMTNNMLFDSGSGKKHKKDSKDEEKN